jgi:hypothetical protein
MADNPNLDKCFTALMDAADALETVAGKVAEAACGLHTLFGDGVPVPREAAQDAAPAPVVEEPEPEPAPVAVDITPLNVNDIRAVLAEKSRDGFTQEIRQIIAAYGANNLSSIDPIHFSALLAAVEKLGVAK